MNDVINNKIIELADKHKQEIIDIRRDIHMHPELGLKEFRTAKLVADKLRTLGIEVVEGIGETGVVGLLHGTAKSEDSKQSKTIMLRADMDALAMQELNDVPYKSKETGKMHACGHDAHTSWLLGSAMILSEMKDDIHGCIKFVFQPAEEGLGGAVRMIDDGVLENPKVDAVIGAHVWPTLNAGEIGVKPGPLMAAPAAFEIIIKGSGGHASAPHLSVDPVAIGCQVYMSLQTIISRKIDATDSVVLSITQFHAGTANNIIPNEIKMSGTVRSFDKKTETEMPKMMESIIDGIVKAHGGSYTFDYKTYYPAVINDETITEMVRTSATDLLGDDPVKVIEKPYMAGEDFSFYLNRVPGSYFMIGNNNEEKGITAMVHNPSFDVDEDILPNAAAVFAKCAIEYLKDSN